LKQEQLSNRIEAYIAATTEMWLAKYAKHLQLTQKKGSKLQPSPR